MVRTSGPAAASPGGAGGSRGERESLGGWSGWSTARAPEVSELGAAETDFRSTGTAPAALRGQLAPAHLAPALRSCVLAGGL